MAAWLAQLPGCGIPWLLQNWGGELPRLLNMFGFTGPVSYTHLTLPTNREV